MGDETQSEILYLDKFQSTTCGANPMQAIHISRVKRVGGDYAAEMLFFKQPEEPGANRLKRKSERNLQRVCNAGRNSL